MKLELLRIKRKSDTIDGQLFIDGLKICDTAENANGAMPAFDYPLQAVRPQDGAAQSASPCDRYPKMDYCGNNSTLPCHCPMLKPGNGVHKRLDGSIIVGTYICPGCLKQSKQAFDSIYDRLRKSAERGHHVTLTIKESYKQ